MKVGRAIGQGLNVTHKGFPIVFALFIFYAVIRFFAAPNETIAPPLRNLSDWGISLLIAVISMVGLNYLWGGVQAFARDTAIESRCKFRGFFGNCSKYFLRQTALSFIVGLPIWFTAFISVVLLVGALAVVQKNLLTSLVLALASIIMFLFVTITALLFSFPWTVVVADEEGVFKALSKGLRFAAGRFFSVTGFFILFFAIIFSISVVVWVAYGFFEYGLNQLGIKNLNTLLREVVGCMLYAYILLFSGASFMSYYLNNKGS